ncbi:MAG TPA: WD40 repeat domain-containing serine/threonine protein kinase [Candidatus Limnocylindria bacterium]|nr:WD40 repeat domain-containing serine/threonine protein kinase [Candidatus Limnocylindria bacterium]
MNTPPLVPDHELLRLIGRGSYGDVWLARNVMGAWRAVKLVYRARFQSNRPFDREFSGIQRYEPISRGGEGLVPILHVGRSEAAEAFYYVMELADPAPAETQVLPMACVGEFDPASYAPRTLRADLQRLGRLPVEECVEVGFALSAGLAFLHRHRLVHRDIKPANIIFVQARAKLADLGLVGGIDDARTLVGTEGYIPPEGPGSAAADIYALGKVLYEAVTGLPPDEFPNPPPDWLTGEIPHGALELHEVILRACETDPLRRYQTCSELQADLALLQSGQSVRRARRLERRVKVLRRVGWLAAAAILISASLGLFASYRAEVERDNAQRAERLRGRAEEAERTARQQLAETQLARAGLERRSGHAGQRFHTLDLLRAAVRTSTNRAELRTEAIAALALPDIREVRARSLPGSLGQWVLIDETFQRYTRRHPDSSLRIHGWDDDRELATLEGARAESCWLSLFSRDGRWINAQVGDDVVFWNAVTGKEVWRHRFPWATGLDFTPDGSWAVMRDGQGEVFSFHLPDGAPGLRFQPGFNDGQFWFSPDGKRLAIYSPSQCLVKLFDPGDGRLLESWSLPSPACPFVMVWSQDSAGFLVAGNDFRGYFYRLDQLPRRPMQLDGHGAEIVGAVVHPVAPYAVTSGWDGVTRMWDLESGRSLLRIEGAGTAMRWRSNGRIGWIEGGPDGARIVESQIEFPEGRQSFQEPFPVRDLSENKGPWDMAFLADERVLAVASYDGIRLWPIDRKGNEVPWKREGIRTRWVMPDNDGRSLWFSTDESVGRIAMAWEKGGKRLLLSEPKVVGRFGFQVPLGAHRGGHGVTSLRGQQVVRWDETGSQVLGNLATPASRLFPSPDGRWLVASDPRGRSASLMSLADGSLIRSLPDSYGTDYAFSLDGESLFILSPVELRRETRDGDRVLWRSRRLPGQELGSLLALSPDGKTLAAVMGARGITLFHPDTGELRCHLDSPEPGQASTLRFSPSGRLLALATDKHSVLLWDMGKVRAHLHTLDLDWEGAVSYAPTDALPPVAFGALEDPH